MTGLGTPLSYAYSQKPAYCNGASEVDPGPHAAHTVSGTHYCYDAVGNQTRSSDGRSIRYTAFDLPDRITHSASNKAIEFDYGAGRERIRRKDLPSVTVGVSPTLVTHFVGNAEIVRFATGKVEVRRYVAGMIRVQTRESPTYTSTREDYVLTDAQGSTYALVKDTGSVLGTMGFDPWGLRRAATNWTPLANPLTFDASGVTRHGYTGHEQVDEAGLIHMNGRIYDPKLMRFVQADPIIQSPFDSQSYNRYTYILNNPLSGTDPTGFEACTADVSVEEGQTVECTQKTNNGAVTATVTGGKDGSMSVSVTGGSLNGVSFRVVSSGAAHGQRTQSLTRQDGQGADVLGPSNDEAVDYSNGGVSGYFKGVLKGVADELGRTAHRMDKGPDAPEGGCFFCVGRTNSEQAGMDSWQAWLVPLGFVRSSPRVPMRVGDGAVEFAAPPGATVAEIAQIRQYCAGCNSALDAGAISPTGRVSTAGALRNQASYEAAKERARAAASGSPYTGHAGHVPDTTWSGVPYPYQWMDISPRINQSLGSQAAKYPVGHRPTEFLLREK